MNHASDPIYELLPLREPTFLILLSLAPGKKHGYAILKDVEELSQGKLRLSTGTLYEALARLLDQNWIERIDEDPLPEDSPNPTRRGKPRKAYRLTEFGRRLLRAEASRMRSLAAATAATLGEEHG